VQSLTVRNSLRRTGHQYISDLATFGLDVEANYSGKLFDRPASFRFLTAWQPHVYYRQIGCPFHWKVIDAFFRL
jgi:hypothetical protein